MKNVFITTVEVKDVAIWRTGFAAAESFRQQAGITVKQIYQSAEKATEVTFISEADDLQVAKAMLDKPEFKAAQERIGVIAVKEIKVLKPLS